MFCCPFYKRHSSLWRGDYSSCCVSQVIEKEKTQENSAVVGTYFMEELAKLRDQFDIVGDVRGKGLMIGMEFVTDKVIYGE